MFHSSGLEGTILLVLNGFSLAAAYLHVLWLMIGTWEAVNERNISGRIHLLLITLSIVVGVVSAWLHSSGILPDWMAGLLAESLLFIVTGIAFIVAAIMLWRTLNPQRMLSSRLTPLAFIAYGLYMLYVGGLNSWINLNNTPVAHAPYLGIVGFLLLILIGYSIIIWLLEIERRRSVSAWEKAQSAERRLIHLRRHDAAKALFRAGIELGLIFPARSFQARAPWLR
jgi:hypothetical protein